MPVLAHVNSLFHNLFRKERIEKELDDEIRSLCYAKIPSLPQILASRYTICSDAQPLEIVV